MKSLTPGDVQEVRLTSAPEPSKTTVEEGDVFYDHEAHCNIVATTLSDSSGWRYIMRLEDNSPEGTTPDSNLLDPRLFNFLYNKDLWR